MSLEQERNHDGGKSPEHSPFEWLTSASSLAPILSPDRLFRDKNTNRRALHLGCGSSMLGDYLVRHLRYQEVVNVDKDERVLKQKEQQWSSTSPKQDGCMRYIRVDLSKEKVPYPNGYFDLVVDKSTLDCTLCSDEATTGLLCQAYQSLKEGGGVYVVVSFHHTDLLLPLLRGCPGAEWDVEHFVIQRQVEDLVNKSNGDDKIDNTIQQLTVTPSLHEDKASVWSTGSFDPSSEHYRKWVNVMVCRKRDGIVHHELNKDLVREHIHGTNDAWFQSSNPMLTQTRQNELEAVFASKQLGLRDCYGIIFTDSEREHLSFEYFLEDWNAYLKTHPNIPRDTMDSETAVMFLEEMQ